jgi:hypothetical protein
VVKNQTISTTQISINSHQTISTTYQQKMKISTVLIMMIILITVSSGKARTLYEMCNKIHDSFTGWVCDSDRRALTICQTKLNETETTFFKTKKDLENISLKAKSCKRELQSCKKDLQSENSAQHNKRLLHSKESARYKKKLLQLKNENLNLNFTLQAIISENQNQHLNLQSKTLENQIFKKELQFKNSQLSTFENDLRASESRNKVAEAKISAMELEKELSKENHKLEIEMTRNMTLEENAQESKMKDQQNCLYVSIIVLSYIGFLCYIKPSFTKLLFVLTLVLAAFALYFNSASIKSTPEIKIHSPKNFKVGTPVNLKSNPFSPMKRGPFNALEACYVKDEPKGMEIIITPSESIKPSEKISISWIESLKFEFNIIDLIQYLFASFIDSFQMIFVFTTLLFILTFLLVSSMRTHPKPATKTRGFYRNSASYRNSRNFRNSRNLRNLKSWKKMESAKHDRLSRKTSKKVKKSTASPRRSKNNSASCPKCQQRELQDCNSSGTTSGVLEPQILLKSDETASECSSIEIQLQTKSNPVYTPGIESSEIAQHPIVLENKPCAKGDQTTPKFKGKVSKPSTVADPTDKDINIMVNELSKTNEDNSKKIEQQKVTIEDLKKSLQSKTEEMKKLESKMKKLEKNDPQSEENQEEISDLKSTLEKIKLEKNLLQSSMDESKKDKFYLEKQINNYINDNNNLESDKKYLDEKIEDLNHQIQKFQQIQKDCQCSILKVDLENAKKENKEMKSIVKDREQEFKDLESALLEKDEEILSLKERIDTLDVKETIQIEESIAIRIKTIDSIEERIRLVESIETEGTVEPVDINPANLKAIEKILKNCSDPKLAISNISKLSISKDEIIEILYNLWTGESLMIEKTIDGLILKLT